MMCPKILQQTSTNPPLEIHLESNQRPTKQVCVIAVLCMLLFLKFIDVCKLVTDFQFYVVETVEAC